MKSLSGTLRRCLTKRGLCLFLAGLLLLSLVPLLALSFYAFPQIDDFFFGLHPRHQFLETGSLISVLKEAWSAVKENYMNWQGTYTAIALFSLQPGIFGEQYYCLTTWILLGMIILSNAVLLWVLIRDYLQGDVWNWGILSCIVIFLGVQQQPSLSQGLYFFSGGIYYIFFHALMLLYLASLLRLAIRPKPARIVWCSVLAIALGGANYLTSLLSIELTALLLFLFFLKSRKSGISLLLPALLLAAGFALSLAAPGNAVRAATSEAARAMSAAQSIASSLRAALAAVADYGSGYLLAAMLLLLPVFLRLAESAPFRFSFPLLVVFASFLLFASSFTPTFYAMGSVGPPRAQNLRMLLFVQLAILDEGYLIGWAVKRREQSGCTIQQRNRTGENCRRRFGYRVALCAVTAALFLGMLVLDRETPIAAVQAWQTIKSGEAAVYRQEQEERIAILNGPGSDVVIPRLTVRPNPLFILDIKDHTGFVWNYQLARYYYKNSVVTESAP